MIYASYVEGIFIARDTLGESCLQSFEWISIRTQASLRVSLGFLHWFGNSLRCSQTYHNCFHGAHIPVIRDPCNSEGWAECPPRVRFSPEIDASKFTPHLLSHTPGGSQRLNYILLMQRGESEHSTAISFRPAKPDPLLPAKLVHL